LIVFFRTAKALCGLEHGTAFAGTMGIPSKHIKREVLLPDYPTILFANLPKFIQVISGLVLHRVLSYLIRIKKYSFYLKQ